VSIDAVPEMATAVGAALLVKVATPVGTPALQLAPVVHWLPGP
jgi:hypothetical protein